MPRPAVFHHFEQRYVQTPDVRIHYAEVETPGQPMVMLHGIGMDWHVWQAISRRLRHRFHLYLVDMRGHGDSEKPAHGYTVPHYAADVEEVVDQLGLSDVVLVGSSLGGMVAAAVEIPADIVSHRILVDPPMTGGPVRDAETYRRIRELKHQPPDQLADFLQGLNPGSGRFLMESMSEMWHRAADGVIDDMLAHPDDYFDIAAGLRGDEAPTLLMRADPARGGVLTERQAQEALTLLPRASAVFVPGAGHAIHATKPVEFVRMVEEFVASS